MPRQLPWLNRTTKTQVKLGQKAPTKNQIDSDDGDDVFEKLTSVRKGKPRGGSESSDESIIDDEFPKTPRFPTGKRRNLDENERALSSSPPPATGDLPPPKIEYMKKGVDRFDLKDDEWMMVEDEFLQTAKLFTRHLHLKEYDRLKENIATKKVVARPVVANAIPSAERKMQLKAQAKTKSQEEALEEVGQLDAPMRSMSSVLPSPGRSKSNPPNRASTHPLLRPKPISDNSDSEDLDAPRHARIPSPSKRDIISTSSPKPPIPSSSQHKQPPSRSTRPPSFLEAASNSLHQSSSPSKPTPKPSRPSTSTSTSTSTYHNSTSKPPLPKTSSPHQPSKHRRTPSSRTTTQAKYDILSDLDNTHYKHPETDTNSTAPPSSKAKLSKEQADRIAKRKAEREKAEKRKSVKLDDIPTFLF